MAGDDTGRLHRPPGTTVAGVELIDIVRSTGAAPQWAADPVSGDKVDRLLDAARVAPSAGTRQPQQVVSVRDAGGDTVAGGAPAGGSAAPPSTP